MPARGLVKGMWGRKGAVAIAAIAAGALLVVVQASAGNSVAQVGAPEFKPQRAASVKGVGASLQGIVRTARLDGSSIAAQFAQASGVDVTASGARVIVESRSGAVAATRSAVVAHGGVVERSADGLVQALVPVAQIQSLGADPAVSLVRLPYLHAPDVVTGEESVSMNASGYTNAGYDGTGVKIGIIDGGFSGYAAKLGTELPASVTTADFCGGALTTATDHGTAVAEIVHEVAPGAQLYLICFDTEVDLASAEAYAKAQGIKIVNHSVSWFDTWRGDGGGPAGTPDAVVADAKANGLLWVNAAGNQGQNHWSGNFIDDGDDDNVFGPGNDIFNRFTIGSGAQACVGLKWDNWPSTTNDFDLYLVRMSDFAIVGKSEGNQTGGGAPVEEACATNAGATQQFGVAIVRFQATSTPRFDMFVLGTGPIQYQTAAGSVTEPASSPNALAVGAICWNGFGLEPYSSQGPNINGVTKPDMSGFDSVSSSTYGAAGACGASGFAGTSAASPGIAGAAALLLQQNPALTPTALQAKIASLAVDLGTAGVDNSFGAGRLLLPTLPVNTTPPTISGTTAVGDTLTVSTGTWSGSPAPTFSYQWRSCDSLAANCTDLGGEIASMHTITSADAAHALRVVVTGTNSSGSSTATSAAIGIPGAPTNLTAPTISGTPQTGATLTASSGSWLGLPTPAFTYQWERCNALGAACTDISLAASSTYVPGVPDLGLTLRVKVSASNTGGAAGPVESAQTAVITAPPSGGGGGGGGGGTGGADLYITGTVEPGNAPVGGTLTWRLRVNNDKNYGPATGVYVNVTVPAGVQLASTSADRGPGCKSISATTLRCDLDWLSSDAPYGNIVIVTNVTAAGQLSLQATVGYDRADPDATNNSVTLSANTPAPTLPPPPLVPAPKLSRTGTAVVKPTRTSTTASVGFGVRLNRAASVMMSVKQLGGTKALLLRAGTKLGPTTSKRSVFAMTAARGSGAFTVKAVFGKTALTKGRTYVVTLVATAPDGRQSTLTVRFKA